MGTQFLIPFLSEAADKRLAEVLVEWHTTFLAFGNGTAADVPTVIVDRLKLAVFVDA